jgi:hypothetical protein
MSKNFLNAVLRQKTLVLGFIGVFAVLSMVAYKLVPRRFKVQSVLSIQTPYFQNPLVRDFLPETYDGSELKSQRESIIRRALSHEFLAELGKRHRLFKTKDDSAEVTSYELDLLAKEFEVVPTSATGFLVGFFNKDPETAYKVVTEFIAHIRNTMTRERHARLIRLHNAIQERLEAIAYGRTQTAGVSPLLASRPDLVRQEADRIREEARVLRTSYSEKHPRVTQLKKRLTELESWLKANESAAAESGSEGTGSAVTGKAVSFSGAHVDPASKDLFQDLLKKFHYLEVVIDLDQQSQDAYLSILQEPFVPKAAIWPKRPLFLIWGIATGFLVGSLFVLITELLRERRRRYLAERGMGLPIEEETSRTPPPSPSALGLT